MTLDLFGGDDPAQHGRVTIGPQSVVLRGFALPTVDALLAGVDDVTAQAPFRHMETPGGYTMSVALTNCGDLGWTTDARGYRYSRIDPVSGQPWPAMPQAFRQLAQDAAREAGFPDFAPDACLVNRYEPGSRLSLHQDRNERDFNAPIVSVSLGMPAMFLFGGDDRADRAARVPLFHGDVVVWGGVDRLRFHGVMPLKDLPHPRLGSQRINFTIRKAG
ncbi:MULTISPECIES: DNA oxidative demethylase AlkB [Achromobacter]|uniref:DNA oxidative demethylase AlkB n=1 Tax=Achromobacter TaxID=222 RepID=UPI001468FC8C|nr:MULTISPECIES: DNA oxidative demethylase AlkB [Achromobacter]MBV7500019.1 DNA oxidative demethylase AlkB [Achromobacter sp. ACM05]CAB3844791.1 Alpha-ketoglutarate-dependent dioxygenase AlkB [Achromobacter animicus]CAB3858063.1 Alpha-ketoglutarate-dependent dioxygenase AlkB [Achromobacter animicus]